MLNLAVALDLPNSNGDKSSMDVLSNLKPCSVKNRGFFRKKYFLFHVMFSDSKWSQTAEKKYKKCKVPLQGDQRGVMFLLH